MDPLGILPCHLGGRKPLSFGRFLPRPNPMSEPELSSGNDPSQKIVVFGDQGLGTLGFRV